jgi:hypothetical protein
MKKIFFLILLLAAFGHKPVQAQTANPSHVGVCLTDSCTGSSAPSYAFVTSTYVAETGVGPFASITSPSLTLSAGQMVDVYCRNGTSTANAFTFSSTPSNTWVALTNQPGGTNNPNATMGYAFNVGAGSTTFTCTPASSAGFMSMIVLVYSTNPIFSTLNTSTGAVDTSGANTITSSSFSTTQAGVIVMCTTASIATGTWGAGTIAGSSATVRQVANTGGIGATADAVCEDIISNSSQSSVTASTNLATGGPGRNFTFTVGAFN